MGGCHKVPEGAEYAMAARLLDSDMAVLVESELLPKTPSGRILVGGFFGVPKSVGKLRLIFDRRPHDPSWSIHNAVGRALSGEFVVKYGGDPCRKYYTCFRVLGMGDLNSVCFGQTIHENLLRQAAALTEEHCLRYGKNTPPHDMLQGVYIDDFLVALQVERADAHSHGEDHELLAKAEKAYEDAGFPRAVAKYFRAQVDFKAWGAEVRDGLGTSGGQLSVRRECWALTRHLLKFGWVCKAATQPLLGIFA
ncbi:unnamed protein product, partial [Polarella glacialis]